MRQMVSLWAVVLFLFALSGCDEILSQQGAKKEPEKPKVVHHFEPIAKSEGSLALDTGTGKMCKTWEWGCSKPMHKNYYTGEYEENYSYGIACSAIATMPTCEQLVKQDEVPTKTQPAS